jgi:hypothetical protein
LTLTISELHCKNHIDFLHKIEPEVCLTPHEFSEGVAGFGHGVDTFDFCELAGLRQGEGPGTTLGHDVWAVHDDLTLLDHVGQTLVGRAHLNGQFGELPIENTKRQY